MKEPRRLSWADERKRFLRGRGRDELNDLVQGAEAEPGRGGEDEQPESWCRHVDGPNQIEARIDNDGSTQSQLEEELADFFAFLFWQLGHPDFQP